MLIRDTTFPNRDVIDQTLDEGVFMQVQGRTALCGLCGLNNAYQIDLFDVQSLNNIADILWTRHYSELPYAYFRTLYSGLYEMQKDGIL